MRSVLRSVIAIVAACGLSVSAARADAIDGDWCSASKSLNIQGSSIRTPGGNTISGDYSRHGFRYTVPAGEDGAGALIEMVLLNDENMELTRDAGGSRSAPERWRRCKPVS